MDWTETVIKKKYAELQETRQPYTLLIKLDEYQLGQTCILETKPASPTPMRQPCWSLK
jgi:hypothetical protein